MIKTAIRVQFQECGGIVTVITLGNRLHMEFGFTDRDHAVMALAAVTENLLVIIERYDGESLRRMTSLAVVAGRHMRGRFARCRCKAFIVAIHAI